VLQVPSEDLPAVPSLIDRSCETLKIMHRWGYSPTVDALAKSLLGGGVPVDDLVRALESQSQFQVRDGFVSLRGYEQLLQRSSERVGSHRVLNGDAWSVAAMFAADLASLCPFVNCVAACGSLAAGGYAKTDDLDFDLFVQSGTKYLTYLLATLIGLRYSWRYGKHRLSRMHEIWGLPKLICINVVWPTSEVQPFRRRDADVAFELLRCEPIFGATYFDQICRANKWLASYFPQLNTTHRPDTVRPSRSLTSSALQRLARHPLMLGMIEAFSNGVVWSLYHFVQWTRRHDLKSVQRMEFLRKVKWPYEILQD